MSPDADQEAGHVTVGRLGTREHRRRRVDADRFLRLHSLRSTSVRSPVPHPRSTTRPPGTGWQSIRRSSKGCWRSERNRSYCSGLHPSIGVTVTSLILSPSRDAHSPWAERHGSTRRLTWGNGSRMDVVAILENALIRHHRGADECPRRGLVVIRLSFADQRVEYAQAPAPERGPGVLEANDAVQLLGRLGPVQVKILLCDLLGHRHVAALRLGLGQTLQAVLQCVDEQVAGRVHEARPKRRERDVSVHGYPADGIDVPRVEPFCDLHEAHTGLGVAREDRPLHRRRAVASAAATRSARSPWPARRARHWG